MELHKQVAQSLVELRESARMAPHTAVWADDGRATIAVDFMTVDRLSCAFRELRIALPASEESVSLDALRSWADSFCRRVTYLLEPLSVQEVDVPAETVLVRSTPPSREAAQVSYYEILAQRPGTISLRRFVRETPAGDRMQIDLQTTHEVLKKLVRDLVESIPVAE